MTRFVQTGPSLPDPYTNDRMLRSWLDRLLGPAGHAAAAPTLTALAQEVLGPLREAHHDAEAHPPTLTRYDAWGARIDRVDTAPGWEAQRRAAARYGLVGAADRVRQHALLHLYGPESATFTCPVAMADGAAALLGRPDVDPAVRDAWLPRLVSTDPATAITSGQWMTESQGGSDISRTGTVAVRDGNQWRLTGEKWFCSAVDSAVAVALARPVGADPGSRTLVPFLVPRYADDGRPAPGITLHRLKDKLGTRAVPTAEVGLDGAAAIPLGDPTEPGLHRMMTLVVVTRLHNAAAAAGGMRRGLSYALSYAGERNVATGRLRDNPLHRATLGALAVDAAGAYALTAHAFALLGAASEAELRLVAPLAKLVTGKLAVSSASEYLECFGGAGYVEDTGLPRLLRDAQVLPIWEGTTNVLAVDVLRAFGGAKLILDRVNEAVGTATGTAAETLVAARDRLAAEIATIDPRADRALAGARGLALRLGYALAAALLYEHAAWSGDDADTLVAALWTQRWLGGADIATAVAEQFDQLAA